MSKEKHVAHSDSCKIGDGKCNYCHEKINGLFMVTRFYDMGARGKEGDRITARCEKCIDSKDKVWNAYLAEKENAAEKNRIEAQKHANDPLRFAKIVGEGDPTYESEYDGRTYTYCFYCDQNIGDGEEHLDHCVYLEAKAVLEA